MEDKTRKLARCSFYFGILVLVVAVGALTKLCFSLVLVAAFQSDQPEPLQTKASRAAR